MTYFVQAKISIKTDPKSRPSFCQILSMILISCKVSMSWRRSVEITEEQLNDTPHKSSLCFQEMFAQNRSKTAKSMKKKGGGGEKTRWVMGGRQKWKSNQETSKRRGGLNGWGPPAVMYSEGAPKNTQMLFSWDVILMDYISNVTNGEVWELKSASSTSSTIDI